MQIFVDFEGAILNNTLSLELFLVNLRHNSKNRVLESLPYNPKTISILKDNYENTNNVICVLYNHKNKDYAEMFFHQMKDLIKELKIIPIDGDRYLTIKKLTDDFNKDFEYIGGSIRDYKIYKIANASSIVSNIFSNIIHFFISNKSKDSRSTILDGYISIFFLYFNLLFPIFAIFPAWMEVSEAIINLNKMKAIFISSVGFMSSAALFRTIMNVDRERAKFYEDIQPLLGESFIINGYKLQSGITIMILFFLFGLYGLSHHIIGGMIGFLFSAAYFILYKSPFWYKWTRMIALMILVNLIFNPIFTQKLFKLI